MEKPARFPNEMIDLEEASMTTIHVLGNNKNIRKNYLNNINSNK